MNNKYLQLLEVSNPAIHLQRAEDLFGTNAIMKLSTRKNMKYRIYPNDRSILVGDINFQDYTKTLDEERRRAFRIIIDLMIVQFFCL